MEDKNILVTGGAGFIGSRFIHLLLEKESFSGRIINLDALTYAANPAIIESFNPDSRYTFIEGDVCDKEKVRGVVFAYDINLIVHFAAETHVDRSIKFPRSFLQTNVMGVFTLLETVRKKPTIHFHHISTDEVFGTCQEGELFTEKSSYDPKSPYSASKASADHLVASYMNTYGIKATLSYCSNNFGPGQHLEKFIPTIINSLITKKPIPVYAKGENIRDWLYVDDHIEGLFRILSKGKIGQSYAIGARNQKKNMEVVKTLIDLYCKKEGLDSEEYLSLIKCVEDRPGHDLCYGINPEKIEKELGFKPKYDFEEALSNTIDWYKSSRQEVYQTF